MNKTFEETLKLYATEGHDKLNTYLLSLSKDAIISCYTDLLTMYFNDLNSSTLREHITVISAGFEPTFQKLGFNGYKQNTTTGQSEHCEAKPKNLRSEACLEQNGTVKAGKKLNGGGNISDYTWKRFEKDKQQDLTYLSSGFVDGRLIFIISYRFCKSLQTRLESHLKRDLPNGDIPRQYVRSADFRFSDYIHDSKTKLVYLLDTKALADYKKYLDESFYNELIKLKK